MDPMESLLIPIIFKYLIAIVGLLIGLVYSKLFLIYRGQSCSIPKFVLAFLGFYWCFYYAQSILVVGGIFQAHQIWVRSPLFVTLTAILFMGLLSLWRLEK